MDTDQDYHFNFIETSGEELPEIVYLHGLAGLGSDGLFLKEAFPAHRIIMPDLPGHGNSHSKAEPDLPLLAAELYRFLTGKLKSKPIVVGHSLGGQLALMMEIMHPGFAEKLHLIAPAGIETFNQVQRNVVIQGWRFSNMLGGIIPLSFNNETYPTPDSSIIESYMISMMERPVMPFLDQIHCEVNVYFGDADPLIPNKLFRPMDAVSFAKQTLDKFRHFQVIAISNAGHWPMYENRAGLIKAIKGK